MGELVSSARPSLAGLLLPGAGLGNCELNCTVFRCRVEFRFSILVNEYFTKQGEKIFKGKTKLLFVLFLLFDNFRGQ